jgi:hypothetical protein
MWPARPNITACSSFVDEIAHQEPDRGVKSPPFLGHKSGINVMRVLALLPIMIFIIIIITII